MPKGRMKKGLGSMIRNFVTQPNAPKKQTRKKATAKNRTSAQLKGATSKGIVGRAATRRNSRLNSIMGEMRKTRGR